MTFNQIITMMKLRNFVEFSLNALLFSCSFSVNITLLSIHLITIHLKLNFTFYRYTNNAKQSRFKLLYKSSNFS